MTPDQLNDALSDRGLSINAEARKVSDLPQPLTAEACDND